MNGPIINQTMIIIPIIIYITNCVVKHIYGFLMWRFRFLGHFLTMHNLICEFGAKTTNWNNAISGHHLLLTKIHQGFISVVGLIFWKSFLSLYLSEWVASWSFSLSLSLCVWTEEGTGRIFRKCLLETSFLSFLLRWDRNERCGAQIDNISNVCGCVFVFY